MGQDEGRKESGQEELEGPEEATTEEKNSEIVLCCAASSKEGLVFSFVPVFGHLFSFVFCGPIAEF